MVQQTHDLSIGEHEVRKRYRVWAVAEPHREWAVLALLAERAPGLAPEPLGLERDGDGRWLLRMTRLPGVPLAGPLSAEQRSAVGEAVRRLHAVVPPAGLGARHQPAAEFLDRVLGEEPPLVPSVSGLVREALAAGRARLSEGLPPAADDVVGLADGNLANVLWDGARCRLVDFEDAGRSDRVVEVADLVEHVSVRLTAGSGPEPGLGLARACGIGEGDLPRLRAYRVLFAVFWLQMLVPGQPAHRRNPPGAVDDQAVHLLASL